MITKVSRAFSAGAFGAIVNSVAAWLLGAFGITAAIGVSMTPHLTPGWIYPRVVWGGMWAGLLLLPFLQNSPIKKGAIISIAPTLATLLYFFPHSGKGMFGVELGAWTFIFPVMLNLLWGIAAGWWYRMSGGRF